jgi:hypothetical protein
VSHQQNDNSEDKTCSRYIWCKEESRLDDTAGLSGSKSDQQKSMLILE